MAAETGTGGTGGGMLAQVMALGPRRLAALAGVGLAVLGLVAVLAWRGSSTPMAPLYGELEPRDAAAVTAALDRARIPHRLAGGGTQILVPVEEVARVRLLLAREGLPAGGGVGWEIFDRGESLTTTPFQQDVNRLRALEGELARTIRGLSGVRAARVHLVLPRRANEQAAATETIEKKDLQPGDLVFFNTMRRAFSHVGIYLGDGKFIHAPRSGAKVRVEDMTASYWQRRFNGARRVTQEEADEALAAASRQP